jgi:gamma-aminobutyric acid type B receptor
MVTGFLLVDFVILLTWQLYDPLQRRIEVFPLEDPVSTEDDIKIRPELEHCESENNNVWLGKTEMSSSLYIFIIKLPEDSRSNMFM